MTGKAAHDRHEDEATSQTFGERASAFASTVASRTGDAAGQVSQTAAAATEQLAARVADEARTAVEETAGNRQRRAEHYLHTVSGALRAGSAELDEGGLKGTAAYTRKAAGIVDNVAREVENTDISSATQKLEDHMRARPLVTFGAAALLGFAAYHLLKARDPS